MTKKTDKVIEPIDADFDDVSRAVARPFRPGQKSSKINNLASESRELGPPKYAPPQSDLFHVEKQAVIDGVEMGVLDNGIPYLTESGLARMCGIDRKVLNRLAVGWGEERLKERGRAIDELLEKAGYFEPELFLKSELNGSPINAYTEPVCLAVLEYYAFISKEPRPEAIMAFRTLARETFRQLIYKAVGYSPEQRLLDSWKHFHDRVDMTKDAVPIGYFGVFREIASMIVPMINHGVMISDKVVPDISVGKAWSEHWKENNLDREYGERIKYDHEYPLYYPASKSNPQPSFAYPDAALGAFRSWLAKHYVKNKYPAYMLGQTKRGTVTMAVAHKATEAFGVPLLEAKATKRIK